MGSGSSARYAAKKENVAPEANDGSRQQPTPDEKPTVSNVRSAHHEESAAEKGENTNVPQIRVNAAPEEITGPAVQASRSAAPKGAPRSPRPQGVPRSPRPQGVPRSPRPEGRRGSKQRVSVDMGRNGSNQRGSLGQALQIAEQMRSPRPRNSESGADAHASEDTSTTASASGSAGVISNRASWKVAPPALAGPSAVEVMDELCKLYPQREFELTAFGALPRLRPGMRVTLGDCKEMPTFNDTTGECRDYDEFRHVWIVQFDDDRLMRVIPQETLHAASIAAGEKKKCLKCCLAYGDDVGYLLIDRQMQKKRWVNFAYDAELDERRFKPKPLPSRLQPEPLPATPEPAKPAPAVVHRKKDRAKPVVSQAPESKDDSSTGFIAGDLVLFPEARGLGVGKVVGEGKVAGEVLVQFGKGTHIYSLESKNLEKTKKSTEMKRRQSFS